MKWNFSSSLLRIIVGFEGSELITSYDCVMLAPFPGGGERKNAMSLMNKIFD